MLAIGHNFSNDFFQHQPNKTMVWPIINIVLAAVVLFIAYSAGALPLGF